MTDSIGQSWILQYHPVARRGECVNIGVVAADPQAHADPTIRLASDVRARLARLGVTGAQRTAAEMQRDAIVARIRENVSRGMSAVEGVERARARQANEVRLAPPEGFRITDFARDVDRLVAERLGSAVARQRHDADERLRELLVESGLQDFVHRGTRLELGARNGRPALPFSVPFAYRNGCMHYLKPARLGGADREDFTQHVALWTFAAAEIAAGGDARLVVVVDAEDHAAIGRAAAFVVPAGGALRSLREPQELLDEIRAARDAHAGD